MFSNSILLPLFALLQSTPVISDLISAKFNPKDDHSWELDYGSYPYQSFRSSDLISPLMRRPFESPQCQDGNYIFLSPRGYQVPNPAVTILDNEGELVWEHYVWGQGYNLKVQEYGGEEVLTFWVGNDGVGGHGEGDYYMYNSRYEEIAKISALNGLRADLHELTITPEGTGMMTIYQIYPINEPGYVDDTDEIWVWDCLFQEIDLETNELVFEWRASEHHSLEETFRDIGLEGRDSSHPWDWYHMNSIQKDELGNYLVSARYTHTITYINGETGEIIWILGGKRNAFDDLSNGNGMATDIAFQHFARFHNLTEFPVLLADEIQAHPTKDVNGVTKMLVTAFDNGADHEWTGNRASRGVLIEVTYPTPGRETAVDDEYVEGAYSAKLIRQYFHPAQFIASSQGSMQILPSGPGEDPRVLLGFGYVGVYTEYTADGEVLCDNRFSTMTSWGKGDVQSYRALKAPWKGEPTWPPSVAFGNGSAPSIYVSWNGATEVREWVLQESGTQGDFDDAWDDVSTTPKRKFETEIKFEPGDARFLRVLALDANGDVLGTSANLDLGWEIGANSIVNGFKAKVNSPLQLAMFSLAALTSVVIAYEGFKQFNSWRETEFLGYEKVRLHSDASSFA